MNMKRKMTALFAMILACCFITTWKCDRAFGQTDIDLTATAIQGPASSQGAGVAVKHTTDNFEIGMSGNYKTEEGDRTGENYSGHIIYDLEINKDWSLSLFDKAEKDYKRGIRLSNQAGFRTKYLISRTDALKASVSAGPVIDHIDYVGRHDKPTAMLSVGSKLLYLVNDFEFEAAGGYRSNIKDLKDDYVIDGSASARYALNDTIGLKLTGNGDYRSESPNDENFHRQVVLAVTVRY